MRFGSSGAYVRIISYQACTFSVFQFMYVVQISPWIEWKDRETLRIIANYTQYGESGIGTWTRTAVRHACQSKVSSHRLTLGEASEMQEDRPSIALARLTLLDCQDDDTTRSTI